ncbi:MAG TPA: beta-L-arabinofuranosidase domain-containing protein [Candidatus Kryptonia bacterium]|nr:beta-L-arabinofuranosidase domain-containing protein [Candidatus Kryptonia bacterium]
MLLAIRSVYSAVVAALLFAATTAPAVSIRVDEPLGVARTNWPLTTGVPFPRGQVRDPVSMALKQSGGRSLTLQTRVLSRWDDKSVRWLLADFPLNIGARVEQTLDLVPGKAAPPAARVQVRERPTAIEVDTGPLRFSVPRDRFAIVQDVRLSGRLALGGPVRGFVRAEVETPTSVAAERRPASDNPPIGAPRTLIVRDRGPVRAEIEMRGQLGAGFDYAVRVQAFAGQSFVRVLFTVVAVGPAEMTALHQLAIEVPLATSAAQNYRFGVEGNESIAGALTKAGAGLVQSDNLSFLVDGARRDGHAAGWADVSGDRGGVGVASRFFWQEYPQGFALQPQMLTYNLWSPDAPAAPIGVGAAKTHEFVLYVFDQPPPVGYIRALVQPLIAQVDPMAIAASGALPNAVAPNAAASFLKRLAEAHTRVVARTAAEEWDEAAGVTCPPPGQERRRFGAFGMLNWGDWNYPGFHDTTKGCDAWGNLEYDLTQVYALAFAATGRADYHDAMTAAARHFMDVDVIHAQPARPRWIGMNHPKNPLHFSFARGGVDLGHTWTEGLVSYYNFTGDERSLEAARGIADYLVRRMKAGVLRGNPRQWGWPQIALLAVFHATGDTRYRAAALQYAKRGIAAYPPTDVANWKLGILADALADTHAATHDPAIETWLRTYASTVVAKSPADQRLYPAVAYVARLTHDPKLAQVARTLVDQLQFGNWAKPFTITGRTGFRILSLLGRDW